MANISRFASHPRRVGPDPLGELDDLFRDFFLSPVRTDRPSEARVTIDVTEDAGTYRIKADIPGVDKDSICVSVDGRRVAISAESRATAREGDSEQVVLSERHYGRVFRSFSLPVPVVEHLASAAYCDGVLELILPKTPRDTADAVPTSGDTPEVGSAPTTAP